MSSATIARRPISRCCVLRRAAGSPIAAQPLERRVTARLVVARRPLALDETVSFRLGDDEAAVAGRARVVCQKRPDVYLLRFAGLPAPMEPRLHALLTASR